MNLNAFAIWFTGLSGSGKTTLCHTVGSELRAQGIKVQILDADEIRRGLCSDLAFSMRDRMENVRRISLVADLLVRNHIVVLVAAITPLHTMREIVRNNICSLIEVFVDAPLHVCELRDPKGLYRRARAGVLPDFTGIESLYEPPVAPNITCHTDKETVSESTYKIVDYALARGIDERMPIPPDRNALSSTRTIAVDFDGVIANYNGWRGRSVLGRPREDVVEALNNLRSEGWKIIVHTTRCKEDIIKYLRDASIPFDGINADGSTDRIGCKPRANIYWDDRALKYSGNARRDLDLIRNFCTWNGRR